MKYLFFVLTIVVNRHSFAQSLPQITYWDYGYSQPVKQVETMYYSLDADSVEKVEFVKRSFNLSGNLESYQNKSFLDSTWSKSNLNYKKGKAHREKWANSNTYLDRVYAYQYNENGKIIRKDVRFKGKSSRSYVDYTYKNGLLHQVHANIDGEESVSTSFYDRNHQLYKKTHQQLLNNKNDIITHYFYLEGKELMSYVAPRSHFHAAAYLKKEADVEIRFKLSSDSTVQSKLLKGIMRFDREAPDAKLPFNLEAYSQQTLDFYKRNKDKLTPLQALIYLRNENGDIVAESEVNLETKKISGIAYSKIEYADGSISGNINFDSALRMQLEAMLSKLQLL